MDGYRYNPDPYRQPSAGINPDPYRQPSAGINPDPYRQPSAGYYAPRCPASYSLEGRSYGLPSADPLSPHARVPIDPFAGYGAPYQHDPRYVSAPASPPYRPRQRDSSPERLGPNMKPFNHTLKVRFSEEKEHPFSREAPAQTAFLTMETQNLYSLFRSGVDTNKMLKPEDKKGDGNGNGKKRKADKKKEKKKKQKMPRRRKPARIETDLKALEMQRGYCKGAKEFFGVPTKTKVIEVANGAQPSETVEDEKDSEETDKDSRVIVKRHVEPQRTPEEEKEAEASAFKFFSSLFAENQELRDFYFAKWEAGSFDCLVCRTWSIPKRKPFWNALGLFIHTKMREHMRPEHIGFGRAIAALLGWDYVKTPRCPRGCPRPAYLKKSADQGKEVTKYEQEQKEVETNVEEVLEEDSYEESSEEET